MHLRVRSLPALALPFVVVLTSAETCGPAVGLSPAMTRESVVADDTLVGDWVEAVADPAPPDARPPGAQRFTLRREDTVDGPSYVLTPIRPPRPGEPVSFRFFVFTVDDAPAGVRFVDAIPEGPLEAQRFVREWTFPGHVYLRLVRGEDGSVSFDGLDWKWIEAEVARDPASAPSVELVGGYGRAKEQGALRAASTTRALMLDTAGVRRLLARAALAKDAWSGGFRLVPTSGKSSSQRHPSTRAPKVPPLPAPLPGALPPPKPAPPVPPVPPAKP